MVRLCRGAGPIAVNGAPTSGQLADDDEDELSPSCALDRADAGEAVYLLAIEEPSLLIARARGTADGSLGDPVLSLRGDCESANSELGCATGWYDPGAPALIEPNPAELRVAVQPGPYALIVDGAGPGNRPRFQLEVITRRLSPRPGNDSCDSPEPIVLTDGSARVRVNLDQAQDDTASCLGRGAPDVVYALSLDSPARVRADVAAQGDEFAVGAYLVQRCGDPMPVACGFGFDEIVPAGEWLLVVDGSSSNSRGSVELDVEVEARRRSRSTPGRSSTATPAPPATTSASWPATGARATTAAAATWPTWPICKPVSATSCRPCRKAAGICPCSSSATAAARRTHAWRAETAR